MYQLPSTPPAVDPLGAQVVVRPGDTLLVGLPPATNGLVAAAQARELETLPDRVPGIDVVLLRGVSSLGVVRFDEPVGDDPADELIAAREEVAAIRAAAQQRVDDLVAEQGRQLATIGQQIRTWASLVATVLPTTTETTQTTEAGAALQSMLRVAADLDGGHRG